MNAGLYVVTVTDANGCTATALADVNQPSSAISTTVTQTFIGCNGAMENTAEVFAVGGNGNSLTSGVVDQPQILPWV